MFICDKCNIVAKKQFKKVIKKRTKIYTYYLIKIMGGFSNKPILTTNEELTKREGNKILKKWTSSGWEIVQELKLCGKCYNKEVKNA